MVDRIWSEHGSGSLAVTYGAGTMGARVYTDIHALKAETEVKKALVTQALQMAIPISQACLMPYERSKSIPPAPILIVLLFWSHRAVRELLPVFAGQCDIRRRAGAGRALGLRRLVPDPRNGRAVQRLHADIERVDPHRSCCRSQP